MQNSERINSAFPETNSAWHGPYGILIVSENKVHPILLESVRQVSTSQSALPRPANHDKKVQRVPELIPYKRTDVLPTNGFLGLLILELDTSYLSQIDAAKQGGPHIVNKL